MNTETWRKLINLESRDVVKKWFNEIHGRELNDRRAVEVNSAAKQAREYFRNAKKSDYSVRPLLTFYGIASLSRALLLLMKVKGGEETLKAGHGLETLDWQGVFSGDIAKGLENIGELKVTTKNGLFSELIAQTNNTICMHVQSSNVDWSLKYNNPEIENEFKLKDLLARLPDLQSDIEIIGEEKYAAISSMTYSELNGFNAKVNNRRHKEFWEKYRAKGYVIIEGDPVLTMSSQASIFGKNLPLFMHSYVTKMFGSIPTLYIVEPFENSVNYSQIGITYVLSYYLGMLVRYFPTYWIAMTNGEKGDFAWPLIHRLQNYVEEVYPELVDEYIKFRLKKAV
jgi:hypothetical protein